MKEPPKEERMISPNGEGKPRSRIAHFLSPSVNSIIGPVFDIPSHTLSSLPPTFDPKNWPLRVDFRGWKCPLKKWNDWVAKMESLHGSIWKKAGVHEAILNSTYTIPRSNDLVFAFAERWCPETKSFIFPWGEVTITLEDTMMIAGYSVLGSPIFGSLGTDELKKREEKLNQARLEILRTSCKKALHGVWLNKFMDGETKVEHEAFLALWLSRFVLPTSADVITQCVFPIAIRLAEGARIALAPCVLANIYRDLSLLKAKVVALTTFDTSRTSGGKCDNDALSVTIWSPFQLVQVWVWERFREFQPSPHVTGDGGPRLARWDKLKSKVEIGRLELESTTKGTFIWRPYVETIVDDNTPMIYSEKEMWISVNSGLNKKLTSYFRCMRCSELVGLDCTEQYLPHRVAMQFGMDQDLPGYVARSNKTVEIAWSCYTRPINCLKFYIPCKFYKAGVTTRYLEWWKQSVLALQHVDECAMQQKPDFMSFGAIPKSLKQKKGEKSEREKNVSSFDIKRKSAEEKIASFSFKRPKVAIKSCNVTKKSEVPSGFQITPKNPNDTEHLISSFKITQKKPKRNGANNASANPSIAPNKVKTLAELLKRKKVAIRRPIGMKEGSNLKRNSEENGEFVFVASSSKTGRVPSPNLIAETDDCPAPPGFTSKHGSIEKTRSLENRQGGDASNSRDQTTSIRDNITANVIDPMETEVIQIGQGILNKKYHNQSNVSSIADVTGVTNPEPISAAVHSSSSTKEIEDRVALNGEKAGSAQNLNTQNLGSSGSVLEIPGLELETRILRIEEKIAALKAMRFGVIS